MLEFLLCLVDVLFNRQSAFPWVSTVLFSSTWSLWNRLHAWYLGNNETKLDRSISITFHCIGSVLSLDNSMWSCSSHLSHWTWNEGFHRHSSVCFIPWSPRYEQWLVNRYKIYVSQMTTDMFRMSKVNRVVSSCITYDRIWLIIVFYHE